MVATSGDRLLSPDAERVITQRLLPLATLVTPNLDEARLLLNASIEGIDDMERSGHNLMELGASAVLIKGGHQDGDGRDVVDVLVTGDTVRHFRHPRIATTSTHGTGCTLSAAVTAGLARGRDLVTAVEDGVDFVHRAIADAPVLGHGHGPVNHFVAPTRSNS
jgi:hydroxymethylpyrimidine/phosphomethylpyrimidine kinase